MLSHEKDNWQVISQKEIGSFQVKVWLVYKGFKPSVAYWRDGTFELVEIKEGVLSEPTFVMNLNMWEALQASMTENHERQKSTVEAELSAVKYHLEDMRKLVFKE